MLPSKFAVTCGIAALALGAALAIGDAVRPRPAADDPEREAEYKRELLAGTWWREHVAGGVAARRVLVLEPGGAFHESVRLAHPGGRVTHHRHEGTWLFDGTNLKRRYTLMDGRPPSRLKLPFATFEIAFGSRDEFDGVDHIHGNRVRYQRVAEGTAP